MSLHACKILESRLEAVIETTIMTQEMSSAEIMGTMEIVKTNFCERMKDQKNHSKAEQDDNND